MGKPRPLLETRTFTEHPPKILTVPQSTGTSWHLTQLDFCKNPSIVHHRACTNVETTTTLQGHNPPSLPRTGNRVPINGLPESAGQCRLGHRQSTRGNGGGLRWRDQVARQMSSRPYSPWKVQQGGSPTRTTTPHPPGLQTGHKWRHFCGGQ